MPTSIPEPEPSGSGSGAGLCGMPAPCYLLYFAVKANGSVPGGLNI